MILVKLVEARIAYALSGGGGEIVPLPVPAILPGLLFRQWLPVSRVDDLVSDWS